MNIPCFIIDNEDHAVEVIKRHILNTPGLEIVGTELNPLIALNKIISGEIRPFLTFLDIDMPQISGMEMARLIREYSDIVFTTAFDEYGAPAFEVDPIDFLLKPISYERFLKAVNKYKVRNRNNQISTIPRAEYFYIQSEGKGKLIRINFTDIYYVESAKNYIRIHLKEEIYLTLITTHEMEQRLPPDRFFRTHKSFLINMEKVQSLEGGIIHLTDGSAIPFGLNRRKDFLSLIEAQTIKSKRL